MKQDDPAPSNRSFGVVFTVIFSVVAIWSWWRDSPVSTFAWCLAGLTLIVTVTKPDLLAPANRAWMKFADFLHRIVNPVALGVMFLAHAVQLNVRGYN